MRFHAIMLVRDCADIIEQSLHYTSEWADFVYVFDTGSIDGTWTIVERVARQNPRVIALERKEVLFHEGLRATVFNRVRNNIDPGDWVVRCDEDEFYHKLTPPEFIKTFVRPHEGVVHHHLHNFKLTTREASDLETLAAIQAERRIPLHERRRYYYLVDYSEPKMFRYRSTMRWPFHASTPIHAGVLAEKRIPLFHYAQRDPLQMRYRLALRTLTQAIHLGTSDIIQPIPVTSRGTIFKHWEAASWTRFLVNEDDPSLRLWQPRTIINEQDTMSHLQSFTTRLGKTIAYSTVVGLLDRTKAHYSGDDGIVPLPAAFNLELQRMYKEALAEFA